MRFFDLQFHTLLTVHECVWRCVLCVNVCKGGLDVMERGIVILQALDLTASRLTPRLAIRRSARV